MRTTWRRPLPSHFDSTRWSIVVAAGGADDRATDALAVLCETYWYPLYGYVRRQGYDFEDARDLTQSFFSSLIERRDLAGVSPERGRFRAFLLASLRHFLLNDLARQRAAKRGGGQTLLPLEFERAERRYRLEPADPDTPERAFDRRWAVTVIERVTEAVRREWVDAGKRREFDLMRPSLDGEKPAGGYAALGRKLQMTENATKVAIHRLRRQFQRRLRAEIAETVSSAAEVDAELRYLLKALQS